MKLASCLVLALLTALPAFAQQTTREDFKEFCQMMAGRWVGEVTWIMDWPGFGKRGDKVTGYSEIKLTEDGHVMLSRFFGGPGSNAGTIVYDAGAKHIRWSGGDSGGSTWVAILYKKDGKWMSKETGSHADGTRYEGLYTITISDNGNTHRWTGSTKIAGKKADEQNDLWRRVSK
jgi:hypothetical protein